jgi:hypothetical protein
MMALYRKKRLYTEVIIMNKYSQIAISGVYEFLDARMNKNW